MTHMEPIRARLNDCISQMPPSPIRELFRIAHDPAIISFAGGHPDEKLFDVEGLKAAYTHVFDTQGGRAMQYGVTDGEWELRQAAAQRIRGTGISAEASNVLITSGSQQGISLLAHTLFNPGDVLLCENPTFMSALQAFGMHGIEFVAIDTDEGGLVPEALEAAIQYYRPKALYTIPTFQNPTGITMPASRREQIAQVLSESDMWLIEDDPYSELRFTDERMQPISADPRVADRAFYLGTLSKVLSPGVRIGWIYGPDEILERVTVTKQGTVIQSSTIDQLAVAHYLETNDLDKKLEPVRETYRQRMRTQVDALNQVLPAGSYIAEPSGGMFVWVYLPERYDTSELVYKAIDAGVIFVPGAPFYMENPNYQSMRLTFVSAEPDVIEEGVARLATVF